MNPLHLTLVIVEEEETDRTSHELIQIHQLKKEKRMQRVEENDLMQFVGTLIPKKEEREREQRRKGEMESDKKAQHEKVFHSFPVVHFPSCVQEKETIQHPLVSALLLFLISLSFSLPTFLSLSPSCSRTRTFPPFLLPAFLEDKIHRYLPLFSRIHPLH